MKFICQDEELTIRLEGREQIAALKAKIVINKKQITNVSWIPIFHGWRRWEVRLPGSAIPGRLIAGSYWTEEGWDFLYLRRPIGLRDVIVNDVLLIELKGHEKFVRVAVTAQEEDYNQLIKWLNRKASGAKK